MNTNNVKKAIAVMQRVIDVHGKFVMANWQSTKIEVDGARAWSPLPGQSFARDEDTLHKCGNAACFAGYLMLSPEWKTDMGIGVVARPRAIADWLEIPVEATTLMVYDYTPLKWKNHILYTRPWSKVRPKDVLEMLERLLAEGPEFIVARFKEYHTLP